MNKKGVKELGFLGMFLLVVSLVSCLPKESIKTGPPFIYLDFNKKLENTGFSQATIDSGQSSEFTRGIKDSCLNLTGSVKNRQFVVVSSNDQSDLTDFDGYTVLIWVKKAPMI